MLDRKPLIWFLIIAFALAWVLFLLPLALAAPGTRGYQVAATIAWSAAMWAPGLAAIVATRWVAKEGLKTLNLGRLGDWRAYIWAWLLFPLLAVATGLLTLAFGAGEVDTQFSMIKQALAAAPGRAAIPVSLVVLIQVAAALTIGPLINMLLALGEELGWRGFLLPRLLPIGQWKVILLSGAIWGIWHARSSCRDTTTPPAR